MGEMERDALIGHGISHCIYDRFFNCSDASQGYVCNKCGSLISTYTQTKVFSGEALLNLNKSSQDKKPYCKSCDTEECSYVNMPFVLRYLTNELAAMNIKLTFKLK